MNTFGTTTVKVPLCDPRSVRINRTRFKREAIPLLDRVTSFYCPSGRWPSRGYILVARADYDKINRYSTDLRLTLDTMELVGLSIVTAQCVTTGVTSDPAALYLVELTDARGIYWNKWFAKPTARSGYNCRVPSVLGAYFPETLNAGVEWTWSTLVGDMWPFGSYPGLPTVPLGAPEDIWCAGVAVWPLLNDILARLGLTITVDPKTGVYSIVVSDAEDDISVAVLPVDDLEILDDGAARFPASVTVYFRWLNTDYVQPAYTYTGAGSGTIGTHSIWDSFTIRRNIDGTPFAADIVTADAIAQERILQYYAQITESISITYPGVVQFTPGSQIDCVLWRHSELGWRTIITSGQEPPVSQIWDDLVAISLVVPPPVVPMNSFFWGVTLGTITARVGGVLGTGFVIPYEAPGGVSSPAPPPIRVFNLCDEIDPSWIVHVHTDRKGTLYASPRCIFPDSSAANWYCMDGVPGEGGGTIDTDCCPDDLLPETLTMNITGKGDFTLTWNGSTGWTSGVVAVPGCGTISVTLTCSGTDFVLGNDVGGQDCDLGVNALSVVVVCDPFEYTADATFSGVGCSCSDVVTVTITP